MTIKDIVPRIRRDRLAKRDRSEHGALSFQREMNRLFDEFFNDFGLLAPWREDAYSVAQFAPKVNVSETDKELKISAELPGMDEKDVSVEMDDDSITIRGERKEEHEEKDGRWYRVEQSYGSFHRVIPLPARVEGDKAKAKFKKGVLQITLPKLPGEAENRKTIAITAED